jgi:hypothetical protein
VTGEELAALLPHLNALLPYGLALQFPSVRIPYPHRLNLPVSNQIEDRRPQEVSQEGEVELMRRLLLLGSVITVALGLTVGCEVFSPGTNNSTGSVLVEGYGGYTTEDEAQAFGDRELALGFPEDPVYDDDMEDHPDVVNGLRNGKAKVYALRVIWGNIDRPDSAVGPGEDCPISDWSGSAEIDGGVVVVKRLIRFDPGDRIVRPRRGARKVEWISHTKDHIDGILFHIIDLPDRSNADAKNTLTLRTPLYTAEIPLESLEDYTELVTSDDCNKISLVSTEVRPAKCPRGFMEGLWVADSVTSGHFKGVWIGTNGARAGYLRGEYRIEHGQRILYGKWITKAGRFGGLLKGTWTPIVSETGPDGRFEGKWVDQSLNVEGYFRGHYRFCESGEPGLFHGRWMQDCR